MDNIYKLQVAMAACEDDFLAMCQDKNYKEGRQKEADGSSLVEVASGLIRRAMAVLLKTAEPASWSR